MMKLRKSNERGHANHGWLESKHTFSFADYYDQSNMGFRDLRVINEDWIAGGMGFATHGHQNMEIITYVIEGSLQHRDTLGNSAVISPGEVQHMSAGTGIRHSEFNHEKEQQTHLLQIWILPDKAGHQPGYGQKSFVTDFDKNKLTLVASHNGEQGSLPIHQDVNLFVGRFKGKDEASFEIKKGRAAWVQVVKGNLLVNGQTLTAGDAAAIEDEAQLNLSSDSAAEFLLFDLN